MERFFGRHACGFTLLVLLSTALVSLPPATAATELDTSFGVGGVAVNHFGFDDHERAWDVALDSFGRILISGQGEGSVTAVARYNADGSLDTTFGTGGIVVSPGIYSGGYVAIDQWDRIVLAGYIWQTGDLAVERYHADGTPDASFGGTGRVTTDLGGYELAMHVAIDASNRVVVAGASNDRMALVRYNTDGSLDTAFAGVGYVIGPRGEGDNVTFDTQGRLVIGGFVYDPPYGNTVYFVTARFNPDGTPDTTFGGTGVVQTLIGAYSVGRRVATDSLGRVLTAGYSGDGSQGHDFTIIRYNDDGSLDSSFGGTGIVTADFSGFDDVIYDVTTDAGGRVVVAGFSNNGSSDDFALARFNADGTPDPSFAPGGKIVTDLGANEEAWGVVIDAQGRMVVAGFTGNWESNHSFALLRYSTGAVTDTVPPTITGITATPNILWPVNKKLVPVQIAVGAVDDRDPAPVSAITGVVCNEAIKPGDVVITGELMVQLRAARSGNAKKGRVYTINVDCSDLSGNVATASVVVTVPHDQGKKK